MFVSMPWFAVVRLEPVSQCNFASEPSTTLEVKATCPRRGGFPKVAVFPIDFPLNQPPTRGSLQKRQAGIYLELLDSMEAHGSASLRSSQFIQLTRVALDISFRRQGQFASASCACAAFVELGWSMRKYPDTTP